MSVVDEDFIIALKLNINGLFLHELSASGNSDIYKAYRSSGGLGMENSGDTHYVMDGSLVIFIGNKKELLGFLQSSY